MSQTLPVKYFTWVEDTSQFTKDFTENYNDGSDDGYFLELDVHYLENLHNLHNDLLFFQKE